MSFLGGRKQAASARSSSWSALSVLALCAAGLWGCQDEPQVKKDADADAGVQAPVADKHIAAAVASAAASGAPGDPAAGDGPPPTGVFGEGEADKQVPPNAPLKPEIISAGSDPKVKLLPVTSMTGKQQTEMTVVWVEGRAPRAARFTLEVSIPEAAKEGEAPQPEGDKPEEKPAAGPVTKDTPIQMVIQKVAAHEEIPLSKDELDKLATLKGTRISAVIAPNGALGGETFELSKKADKSKVAAVRSLVDTVSLFFSPWPDKPVGVGGYWIASDRATMGGLELVRYRVTKLEEMKGDNLVLTMDIRLYAASAKTLPAGAPPTAVAVKFQGQGKGAMNRKRGMLLPIEGQVQAPLVLQYVPSEQAQMGQVYQQQYAAIWSPLKKEGDKKDGQAAPAPAPAPPPAAP